MPASTPPSSSPRLLPLAVFTAAYMVSSVAVSLSRGNTEFVFYIVVMLVLIAVKTKLPDAAPRPVSSR